MSLEWKLPQAISCAHALPHVSTEYTYYTLNLIYIYTSISTLCL